VERADGQFDWGSVLNPSEELLCTVFQDQLVLDSLAVSEKGMALGLNENSLGIYKSYSPLLWRPASGLYALVGSDIPAGLIERLEQRRGRPRKSALEFGWTSGHTMLLARHVTDGVWLSGILSLPAAVQKVIQGDFRLYGLGTHELGTVSIKKANAFGFKSFLRMFGGEVGDIIVTTFDPRAKRCAAWLGGAELLGIVQSGPDAVLSYLTKVSDEELLGDDTD
jgi:hypothetical protein